MQKTLEQQDYLSLFLKSFKIFANLDYDELEDIKELVTRQKFKKGQTVFFENESEAPVYFVESGRLKAFKCSTCGKEQIVRIVNPNEIFCIISIFNGCTCAYTEALEDTTVYAIKKSDMRELVQKSAKISFSFLAYLSENVKRLSSLVETLSFKDVALRLAELLIQNSKKNSEGSLSCPFTQKEMASLIGTAREVVQRTLKRLEQQNLIEVKYHEVILLDPDKLNQLR